MKRLMLLVFVLISSSSAWLQSFRLDGAVKNLSCVYTRRVQKPMIEE